MKWIKQAIWLLLVIPLSIQNSTPALSQTHTDLFNMSYLFFGSTNTYINQVDKTMGSLNVVSPNYFDISKEGTLDITWRLNTSFISEMHKRGIKVVPFLANHWDTTAGINGLQNRNKLARDIAAAIDKFDLDGVNVDIEGVGHAYRDIHTDFIRLLRQYIPSNKEVSVAVAANPNGWKTGWHGFYDYNGLGKYANYLMIMAYDESWESPESPIGPVSSISFFEKSIQYAINQGVPKDRIVAGLPFYGRMWKLDGPTLEGKNITGKGLSSTYIQPLVTRFNGNILFDEKTQSSYATFTIPKGQNAFVGSTNLTEGNYVIWYENEPSIKAKLRLPKLYGIKGTGSWALYHETADTWDYYLSALNWKDANNLASTYSSGTVAVTTSSVNLRASAETNGLIKRTLSADTIVKVTGELTSTDNNAWYPVQLGDGMSGYLADNYIKQFQLKELNGKNRYETSTLISSLGWENTAQTVVLGRGDIPIDALTGSVLAKKNQAPLLLTASNTLPMNVADEIVRLNPTKIYILGGESAISRKVQSQLEQNGYNVTRIAGANRYATSVSVANQVGINEEIILTTGRNSPDPLSIAPYAGIRQIPIILTQPDVLPSEIRTLIREHSINKVTIIGGEEAVNNSVVNELREMNVSTIQRVMGKDRYETSVAVAKHFKNEFDLNELYFASGLSFIDALPGSPLAAIKSSPIILVHPDTVPPAVSGFLQNEVTVTPNISILGGYEVISKSARTNLFLTLR